MKSFILISLYLLFSLCSLTAQVVETSEFDSTATDGETYSELFDQASVSFTQASPFLTLKSFKFSALIGKGSWDMYIYNTVPAVSVTLEDTVQALSDGVLNQIGGLINLSLSKVGFFGNGGDRKNREVKGGQIDFRIGGKVLDAHNRSQGTGFLVPVLQSSLDLRYLIPLVSPDIKHVKKNQDLRQFMKGNLSLRLYGTALQVLPSAVYDQYFTDERGIQPQHTVFTGNVELNVFITNEFYISVGHTISSQPTLPNRTFFSISYAGQ